MNTIKKFCLAVNKKKEQSSDVEIIGETLCIDCRKCLQIPDIRSSDCVRCIVYNISKCGNSERIKLRTSKDVEISGIAAEILCDMAFLDRSAHTISRSEKSHSCNNCEFSCVNIFNVAWQGFPDPFFESARGKLLTFRPTNRDCDICLQKTYRALDQAELGLNNIKKKVSLEAAKTGVI